MTPVITAVRIDEHGMACVVDSDDVPEGAEAARTMLAACDWAEMRIAEERRKAREQMT